MKTFKAFSFSSIVLFSLSLPVLADVFSVNVVGYINLPIYAGGNLIANQLYAPNNTLNGLFGSGTPDGATCTKWDAVTQQFLTLSTYTSGGGWSINYDLQAGEGALFHSDSLFTNTLVGEVHGFDGENLLFNYPTVSEGTYLLSCSVPFQSDFNHVIGRDPNENESVRQLDSVNQTYHTTTFHDGAWDNGDPTLRVGESAFFTIVSPVAVIPEPNLASLFAFGLFIFGAGRMAFKKK